jgi:hypothetical protein
LNVQVVKVKCAACGEEHLLFDNRIHGYDAVAAQKVTAQELAYKPHFRRKWKAPMKLSGMLFNEPTHKDFQKSKAKLRNFAEEEYANSFYELHVSKVDDSGKPKEFVCWFSHHKNQF